MITRLHHAALCVTDITRSKRFYAEVLGLREVPRPDFDFPGAWYQFDDGSQLHLIVHDTPLALRGTTEIDTRDGHLALRVDSYRGDAGAARSAGHRPRRPVGQQDALGPDLRHGPGRQHRGAERRKGKYPRAA